jgi:transcriptional regulator GlxA family with amidase domain
MLERAKYLLVSEMATARNTTSESAEGQCVDRMRVEAAQQMIDSSAMGLKEIADACGFQTPLAMRRTFLRVLGITAGEYASRFKRSQSQTEMDR